MSLATLSNELLLEISEYLDQPSDLNAFCCVNRHFYHLVDPLLYRHNVEQNNQSAFEWVACNRGNVGTLEKLVAAGADVNFSMYIPWLGLSEIFSPVYPSSPLGLAAENGHIDMVQYLLRQPTINPEGCDDDELSPLTQAAGNGHTGIVKLLLDTGHVNPNGTDGLYNLCGEPLARAALGGHGDVVRLLLDAQSDHPRIIESLSNPFLLWAAVSGHNTDIVAMLLATAGVDPTKISYEFHRSPLSQAAIDGHTEMVKLLLDDGRSDPNGGTPLCEAAKRSHTEVIKLLLADSRVSPNQRNSRGATPLLLAVETGNADVVNLLVEDPRIKIGISPHIGDGPLCAAVERRNETIFGLICPKDPAEAEAAYDMEDICQAFWTAIKDDWVPAFEMIMERKLVDPAISQNGYWSGETWFEAACRLSGDVIMSVRDSTKLDLNRRDGTGQTLLHHAACAYEGIHMIEILMQRDDINLDSRDNFGRTPLFMAVQRSSMADTVDQLLATGKVNVNHRANCGLTPLLAVVVYRVSSEVMVSTLLARGADPNAVVKIDESLLNDGSDYHRLNGRSALSIAAEEGLETLVEVLLESDRIDPNARSEDADGLTALMWAITPHRSRRDIIDTFVKGNGVDLDAKDLKGRTALLHAVLQGHADVAKQLLESERVDPNSADDLGYTPLSEARSRGYYDLVEMMEDYLKLY